MVYAITLFAQAFSSMVFFNPNSFIALLGVETEDDCFPKSTGTEEFAYSRSGIATANIIKFVIVHGIKECIRMGLNRTLRRGETIARHAKLGEWSTQRS